MLLLPTEILINIFKYLNHPDFVSLSISHPRFKRLLGDKYILRQYLRARYFIDELYGVDEITAIKHIYLTLEPLFNASLYPTALFPKWIVYCLAHKSDKDLRKYIERYLSNYEEEYWPKFISPLDLDLYVELMEDIEIKPRPINRHIPKTIYRKRSNGSKTYIKRLLSYISVDTIYLTRESWFKSGLDYDRLRLLQIREESYLNLPLHPVSRRNINRKIYELIERFMS